MCQISHVIFHMSFLGDWGKVWSKSMEGLLSTVPNPSSFSLEQSESIILNVIIFKLVGVILNLKIL